MSNPRDPREGNPILDAIAATGRALDQLEQADLSTMADDELLEARAIMDRIAEAMDLALSRLRAATPPSSDSDPGPSLRGE